MSEKKCCHRFERKGEYCKDCPNKPEEKNGKKAKDKDLKSRDSKNKDSKNKDSKDKDKKKAKKDK